MSEPRKYGEVFPAGGQEQQQVQCEPSGRRVAGREAEERAQADGDLQDRDAGPRKDGMRDRERPENEPAGRAVREADQLTPDVAGGTWVQEPRIAQLLHSRVDQRHAEEEAQRQQRDAGVDAAHAGILEGAGNPEVSGE